MRTKKETTKKDKMPPNVDGILSANKTLESDNRKLRKALANMTAERKMATCLCAYYYNTLKNLEHESFFSYLSRKIKRRKLAFIDIYEYSRGVYHPKCKSCNNCSDETDNCKKLDFAENGQVCFIDK